MTPAHRPKPFFKPRSSPATLRKALVDDARKGGITLVLGAGVSFGRGIPGWGALAKSAWARTFGDDRCPSWLTDPNGNAAPHPLAYAMAFEEIEHELRRAVIRDRKRERSVRDPSVDAANRFTALLKEELYRDQNAGSDDDTLGTICRHIRNEQARVDGRIRRVITFNVDDLLEQSCHPRADRGRNPVVWPIARAGFHPRRAASSDERTPIPVYHVHGYLPRDAYRQGPDTLVFTDQQYWQSVASPSSFANRTIANALHDSHCVFVGLSMTDVNIMRWLGVRRVEIEDDYLSREATEAIDPTKRFERIDTALLRHYWITTAANDPSDLVERHLGRRGVRSVRIAWGEDFARLMDQCFER